MKYLQFIFLILVHTISTGAVEYEEENEKLSELIEEEADDLFEADLKKEFEPTKPSSQKVLLDIVNKLKQDNPKIPHQAAVDVAALLENSSKDPETMGIANELKDSSEIWDIRSKFDEEEVVQGLEALLEKMAMMTIMFENPARAFVDLRKADMISKDDISEFKGDPQGYAEKQQIAIWHSFIKLAAAGEYL